MSLPHLLLQTLQETFQAVFSFCDLIGFKFQICSVAAVCLLYFQTIDTIISVSVSCIFLRQSIQENVLSFPASYGFPENPLSTHTILSVIRESLPGIHNTDEPEYHTLLPASDRCCFLFSGQILFLPHDT